MLPQHPTLGRVRKLAIAFCIKPTVPILDTFNESNLSMKSFIIEDVLNGGEARVEMGAFKNMNIETIELGNNFGELSTKAFQDLPKLKKVSFSKKSLKTIRYQSFKDLPSLTSLDLRYISWVSKK